MYRQRGLAVGALLASTVALVASTVSAFSGGDGRPPGGFEQAAKQGPILPELPRGGRAIFPRYRVVAFYGAPQNDALGALGVGTPSQAARRLGEQGKAYRAGRRPVMPAFELIATVAARSAGGDGSYSYRQPDAVVRRYLRAARRQGHCSSWTSSPVGPTSCARSATSQSSSPNRT